MKKLLLLGFIITRSAFASVPEGYEYKGVLIQIGRAHKQYVMYSDNNRYVHTAIPSNKIKLDSNIGWSLSSNGYGKPVIVYTKGAGGGSLSATCDDIYLIREIPKK